MKNRHRIISLLLTVIMVIGIFTVIPVAANAAETDIAETGAKSGTTGDCTWTLNGTVLTISGNGEMDDGVDFDEDSGEYAGTPWGTGITKLVITDGVTNIGKYAFMKCEKLTSVTIPESVTSIGGYAFYRCSNL